MALRLQQEPPFPCLLESLPEDSHGSEAQFRRGRRCRPLLHSVLALPFATATPQLLAFPISAGKDLSSWQGAGELQSLQFPSLKGPGGIRAAQVPLLVEYPQTAAFREQGWVDHNYPHPQMRASRRGQAAGASAIGGHKRLLGRKPAQWVARPGPFS